MGKTVKLGDFAKRLSSEKRTPLQKVVPVIEKAEVKKFLMNMPVETYEFLRKKAFEENTDMKTLILSAIQKTYLEKFEQ